MRKAVTGIGVLCTCLCVSVSWAGLGSDRSPWDVDWHAFMAKQDLRWQALPKLWDEAPFIGNGRMGSMLFRQDDHHLVIQIGRGDVQEHRAASGIAATGSVLPDSSRVPVGHFTLKTAGRLKGCDLRLNLWDAEITGTIRTDQGTLELRAFIHSGRNLLVVDVSANEGESGVSFNWHPEEAFCPRVKGRRKGGRTYRPEYTGNPAPVMETHEHYKVCVQPMTGGGQTATAWSVRGNAGRTQTLFASVEHTFPEEDARARAVANIEAVRRDTLDTLLATHRRWWHAFYPKSFVSLPDARMESFFWIQHYKMACATRGGQLLADNQGVWLQPTGWPALWWNLNVQLAYSHLLPANHPELSEGLINRLYKYRENLASNVPERMRGDSMAINTVSGQDLISPVGDPLEGRPGAAGNLTWALHNCYMHYRYTMDDALLREKVYPLLKQAINYYRHILTEGDDGKLHLPRTNSPEYGDAADCNYDLALLRWGCQTLIDSCARLGIDDPLLPKWKDILARLTPYPVDENGFMIGRDVPFARSHRHYSHLLMLYPLCTMDLDDPAQLELAQKSVRHWQSLPQALAGYSYTGSSSMYSLFGDGERAEQRLQDFFEDKVLPNTFYKEGSPVIETPPAAARAIEDMLIQSWGDRIRVFPAIPAKWSDVAFADLRTEGAFLVSAVRRQGKTAFIVIKSLAGEACRIQTGIESSIKVLGLEAQQVRVAGDGLVELDLPKGGQAVIVDAAYQGPLLVAPVSHVFHTDWTWGKSVPVDSESVRIYPAPEGVELSRDFTVAIDGKDAPVYQAKIPPAGPIPRLTGSRSEFGFASFASFDLCERVEVTVTCPEPVESIKVLPTSYGIVPKVHGRTVTIPFDTPRHVTVEVNGDWHESLHLFANPFETDVPKPGDPNVVYFGPGIHELTTLAVGDNTTVYVAGGAVVRCGRAPDEQPIQVGPRTTLAPSFILSGTNITFRGRGLIEQTAIPRAKRRYTVLAHDARDVTIEGVTFLDPSRWTIPLMRCDRVHVDNIKIIGWRGNSDGVDISNSRDVLVENCFMRTLDDAVVVKSFEGQGEVKNIRTRQCVIWNELAHSLSIGAEIRENVSHVIFEDCDIIHDVGRETALRIYHCDDAVIRDVTFENIRVEEARRLISCWIGKTRWTKTNERGHVRNVTFRNITAVSAPIDPTLIGFQDGSDWKPYLIRDHASMELVGFDDGHLVEDVVFENVVLDGRKVGSRDVTMNEFARNVRFK